MIQLHWLYQKPHIQSNVTWGVPWPKGKLTKQDSFVLKNQEGMTSYVQSWPLAYWPDGSVKWTGHTADFNSDEKESYVLSVSKDIPSPKCCLNITETEETLTVHTQDMTCIINKQGNNLIEETRIGSKLIHQKGHLKAINETHQSNMYSYETYLSHIQKVTVEQEGPIRAVIKIEGTHTDGVREWLPFVVRLYFSADSTSFKIVHTFFYDGNPEKDFIKGIGLEFEMNLQSDELNRHARYALDEDIYSEPAKLLLTRFYHVNNTAYEAQIRGEVVEPTALDEKLLIKARGNTLWNDFKLSQDAPNHYKLVKRSEENLTYIDVTHGQRAQGLMYVGDEYTGMAMGLKNFWQKYPSSLEVQGLAKSATHLTLWLWDPAANAMDLRHYSDTHHMSAYEGFEEVRSTPVGIANTSEIFITCFKQMPCNQTLSMYAKEWQDPALLVASPEYYYSTKATGVWGLPDYSTPEKAFFEKQLDQCFDFYEKEIDQRSWYGYWHFGDVMHTYDGVRHQWRYDLGGYAWQNTELAPNIWLWYHFLRTGDYKVFKMAENMTRHTSEVDRYHFGEYKGLGSRHNVVHWGCSCKEVRISMAGLFKPYYYLTADERVGDLLSDVKDVDQTIDTLEPLRTYFPDRKKRTHIRVGPDWATFTSNWETEWERTEDIGYKNKIVHGIEYLKTLPLKLLSGPGMNYDTKTASLEHIGDGNTHGYHMMICFGAPQAWIEIGELLEDETWKDMLAEYGEFYLLPDEEKRKRTNGVLTDKHFAWPMFATGMAAYAANRNKDEVTAQRAWALLAKTLDPETKDVIALRPVHTWRNLIDDPHVTTNCVSQWCINTIMCLELIGDFIPKSNN